MRLWKYEGKRVRIINKDGQVYTGLVDIYSHADDNESGIASILFVSDEGLFIEIEEPEIKKIDIIAASVKDFAVAV